MEDLEEQIKLLEEAWKFDTPFKLSAELKRLKELNGHVQEDINHAIGPFTAQMLTDQQAKIRKRAKRIRDFGELSTSDTRNTYDTHKALLQDKFNYNIVCTLLQ
jgi:hypothetical protein